MCAKIWVYVIKTYPGDLIVEIVLPNILYKLPMKKQEKAAASPNKSKAHPAVARPEGAEKTSFKSAQSYTMFDYIMMVSFAVLLLGMFFLKFAEDTFVQNSYQATDSVENQYYQMFDLEPYCTKAELQQRYQELSKIW